MLIRHQTPSALCRQASVTHSHEWGYAHSNHIPQRCFERRYYSVFIGYTLPTVALKLQLKQGGARQTWKVNHALGMREITKSNCKEWHHSHEILQVRTEQNRHSSSHINGSRIVHKGLFYPAHAISQYTPTNKKYRCAAP